MKGNHERLHDAVQAYFDHIETTLGKRSRPAADFYESVDKGHGRLEQRRCWVVQSLDWLEERGIMGRTLLTDQAGIFT